MSTAGSHSSAGRRSGLLDGMVDSPVARCEACGFVYELDDLHLAALIDVVGDCDDCGGPLYLVDRNDVVEDDPEAEASREAFVDGWVNGWNARCDAIRCGALDDGADSRRTFEDAIAAVDVEEPHRAVFAAGWVEGWNACGEAVSALVATHPVADRTRDVVLSAVEAAS